ncbi:hypothetical protein KGQ71_00750 [Patescibacteria group bacterium]|nr:hypothetical protein [Patescibacteria group bacterium]
MTILYALIAIAAGFYVELRVFWIVRFFGHLDWAERYLGPGGSYTAWRIIGIILIVAGFWEIGSSL